MKDGTLPHFIPRSARAIAGRIGAARGACERQAETRLWGAVVIDGTKCVSCRMCATFCPTGAIAKFDDADGTLGVAHTPGDCVKCGQLWGRVPGRRHHAARCRACKLAHRRQPPPLRHDAAPREPYRQPTPDPRHLPPRLQRRHLRTVEPHRSPGPSAQGVGEPLASRPSTASRRSPHGGDGIVVRRTSDFSAKQERSHLPTAPASAPAATRPRSAPAPGAPILFTAPGAFYTKGKRRGRWCLLVRCWDFGDGALCGLGRCRGRWPAPARSRRRRRFSLSTALWVQALSAR